MCEMWALSAVLAVAGVWPPHGSLAVTSSSGLWQWGQATSPHSGYMVMRGKERDTAAMEVWGQAPVM